MAGADSFIRIHSAAPAKPDHGEACNGCGVCCAASPCPLSRLLLAHRSGPCPALLWRDSEQRYLCGMVIAPANFLRWLPTSLQALFGRLSHRWIAADSACDSAAEVSEDSPD